MNSADRECFFNDLRAALMAGVPIDVGLKSGGTTDKLLTLGQLEKIKLESSAGTPIDSPRSAFEFQDRSFFPTRLAVAAQVFDATHDMPLVLRGLSVGIEAARTAVRSLRWTIAYLVIVLFVAWLGTIFFAVYLVPEMESMRADLLFSKRPELAESNEYLPWIGQLVLVLGVILAAFMIALWIGGVRRFVMLIGGRYFVRSRVDTLANEVFSRLVEAGVDVSRSKELCLQLTGAESETLNEADLSPEWQDVSTSIRRTSSFRLLSGERKLAQIKATIPSLLVFLIGGCIALVYGAAVFAPIIQLLHDLAISGV